MFEDAAANGRFVVAGVELASHDAEITRIVTGIYRTTEHRFRALIEQGQRDGEIAAGIDSLQTADGLFGLLLGLWVLVPALPERPVLRAASLQVLALVPVHRPGGLEQKGARMPGSCNALMAPTDRSADCRSFLTLALVVTVLVLFAASCSRQRSPLAKSATPGEPAPPRAVVPVVLGEEPRQKDPFRLDSAAVKDDLLTVEVSYSGGCRRHEFTLAAPRPFQMPALSSLVQLAMTLIHDANGDRCEGYPSEQLRFDLRPISRLYRETFNEDSGTVYLRLDGHSGPLVYRF